MARRAHQSALVGATLIECVSAILVLGIAIPPLLALFREVAAHESERTQRSIGVLYAEALMEEIASKQFEDPDQPVGSFGTEEGLRALYDDVDDFDGLSNAPPERFDGTPLAAYGGFRRRVVVHNVQASAPDTPVPAPDGTTDLKRITVTVEWPGGEVSLATLRTPTSLLASPIAEDLSAAGASDDNRQRIKLPLISVSGQDVLLGWFSLSADVATAPLREVRLDGKRIFRSATSDALPTGPLSLSGVPNGDRTIPAFQSPGLEIRFDSDPVGIVTYTLVLGFEDGSSSTITFTVAW